MFKTPSLATALKASTVAGLAAAVLATGVPLEITRSYAEAVNVQAPQVPSFANVVDAVSPAVVSVRVESRIKPASDDGNGFSFDFNGRGFDDLPDDHPLKRFFKQFGEQGPNGGDGQDGHAGEAAHHQLHVLRDLLELVEHGAGSVKGWRTWRDRAR